jgi:hypothetical protein
MISIDKSGSLRASLASTRSFECSDFKTKKSIINEAGERLYQFQIAIPGRYRLEQYPVKVYAKKDPIEGASVGDSVELGGVTIEIGYLPPTASNGSDDGSRGRGRLQFWRIMAKSVGIVKAGD